MRKQKMLKRISLLLILTIVIGSLAGCNSKEVSSSDDKSLTFGSIGYFCNENMDPADGWNGWYIGYYGITQQLFKLDDKFDAQNWLVDSYEQLGENKWAFNLKHNVKFHNGKDMTADSVKNCFERTIEVNERAKSTDWLDSFEADGQTLIINTKRPVVNIVKELADPLWVVYYADEKLNYDDGNSYGTGPFKLKSFSANDKVEVVKNNEYWGDEPKLDSATFLTINDTQSLAMGLQSGEIDMAIPLLSDGIQAIEGDDNLVIDKVTSSRGQFLQFNLDRDLVKDEAVRQAISMCIDRENYAAKICNDTAVPSYGIYSESLSFANTDKLNLKVNKYDLEGAKQLLKDVGYTDSNSNGVLDKDGKELELKLVVSSVQDDMVKMCEDLQSKLSEVGIKLDVVPMENTSDSLNTDDYDINCTIYGMAPIGIADYFINIMFVSDGSGNIGHYSNEKVDKLAKELKTTFDKDKNQEIVNEIQQEVIDDGAFVFFAHKKYVVAYSKKITGYKNNPTEYYALDENIGIE